MTKHAWLVFLLICAAIFVVLEGYALLTGSVTLSQVVWAVNDRAPTVGIVVAFTAGFVAGHWFWPRRT